MVKPLEAVKESSESPKPPKRTITWAELVFPPINLYSAPVQYSKKKHNP